MEGANGQGMNLAWDDAGLLSFLEPAGRRQTFGNQGSRGYGHTNTHQYSARGDSQGFSRGDSQGLSRGDSQGFSRGDSQGFSRGDSQGFSRGDGQGFSRGDSQGLSRGDSQGFSRGDSQGLSRGDSQGFSRGDSQGLSRGDSQGLSRPGRPGRGGGSGGHYGVGQGFGDRDRYAARGGYDNATSSRSGGQVYGSRTSEHRGGGDLHHYGAQDGGRYGGQSKRSQDSGGGRSGGGGGVGSYQDARSGGGHRDGGRRSDWRSGNFSQDRRSDHYSDPQQRGGDSYAGRSYGDSYTGRSYGDSYTGRSYGDSYAGRSYGDSYAGHSYGDPARPGSEGWRDGYQHDEGGGRYSGYRDDRGCSRDESQAKDGAPTGSRCTPQDTSPCSENLATVASPAEASNIMDPTTAASAHLMMMMPPPCSRTFPTPADASKVTAASSTSPAGDSSSQRQEEDQPDDVEENLEMARDSSAASQMSDQQDGGSPMEGDLLGGDSQPTQQDGGSPMEGDLLGGDSQPTQQDGGSPMEGDLLGGDSQPTQQDGGSPMEGDLLGGDSQPAQQDGGSPMEGDLLGGDSQQDEADSAEAVTEEAPQSRSQEGSGRQACGSASGETPLVCSEKPLSFPLLDTDLETLFSSSLFEADKASDKSGQEPAEEKKKDPEESSSSHLSGKDRWEESREKDPKETPSLCSKDHSEEETPSLCSKDHSEEETPSLCSKDHSEESGEKDPKEKPSLCSKDHSEEDTPSLCSKDHSEEDTPSLLCSKDHSEESGEKDPKETPSLCSKDHSEEETPSLLCSKDHSEESGEKDPKETPSLCSKDHSEEDTPSLCSKDHSEESGEKDPRETPSLCSKDHSEESGEKDPKETPSLCSKDHSEEDTPSLCSKDHSEEETPSLCSKDHSEEETPSLLCSKDHSEESGEKDPKETPSLCSKDHSEEETPSLLCSKDHSEESGEKDPKETPSLCSKDHSEEETPSLLCSKDHSEESGEEDTPSLCSKDHSEEDTPSLCSKDHSEESGEKDPKETPSLCSKDHSEESGEKDPKETPSLLSEESEPVCQSSDSAMDSSGTGCGEASHSMVNEGSEQSNEDNATEETVSQDVDADLTPTQYDELATGRAESCAVSTGEGPGIPSPSEEQHRETEETDPVCYNEDTDTETYMTTDSQMSCGEKLTHDNASSSHNKENMLRNCSVVLVREQHPVSTFVENKPLKHSAAKPRLSWVPKKDRPVKHTPTQKRPSGTHPIRHCSVVLSSQQQSSVKSKHKQVFTKKCARSKLSSPGVSSYSSITDNRRGSASLKKSLNSVPLKDCFVNLNQNMPTVSTVNQAAVKTKQSSQLQAWQGGRSSRKTNVKLKSTHASSALKLSGEWVLNDCVVVLNRDQVKMAEKSRHPVKRATKEWRRAACRNPQSKRKGVCMTVATVFRELTGCFVAMEREQPGGVRKCTAPSKNKETVSVSCSHSASDPNHSHRGRSVIEASTDSKLTGKCFVLLTSADWERKSSSSSREWSESRCLNASVRGPSAARNTAGAGAQPGPCQRLLSQKRGRSVLVKGNPSSGASALPRCVVVLTHLPEPVSADGGRENTQSSSRLQAGKKSSDRSPLPQILGERALRNCWVDLHRVDQKQARQPALSISSELSGSRDSGSRRNRRSPDCKTVTDSLDSPGSKPAPKRQGRMSQEQALLRDCCISLTHLPETAPGKEPPTKRRLSGQESSCTRNVGRGVTPGRRIISDMPSSSRKRERGVKVLTVEDYDGDVSTTSLLKECSIVLTPLQEPVNSRACFMDESVWHQAASGKNLPETVHSKKRKKADEKAGTTGDALSAEPSEPQDIRPARNAASSRQPKTVEEQSNDFGNFVSSARGGRSSSESSMTAQQDRLSRNTPSKKATRKKGKPVKKSCLYEDISDTEIEDSLDDYDLLVEQSASKERERTSQTVSAVVQEGVTETGTEQGCSAGFSGSCRQGVSANNSASMAGVEHSQCAGSVLTTTSVAAKSVSSSRGRTTRTPSMKQSQRYDNSTGKTSAKPSVSNRKEKPTASSAENVSEKTPLRGQSGKSRKKGAAKPTTGPDGEMPPLKKRRQQTESEDKSVEGVDTMMSAAGIWVKPFSEQDEEGGGTEISSVPAPTGNKRRNRRTGISQSDSSSKSKVDPGKRRGPRPQPRKETKRSSKRGGGKKKPEPSAGRGDVEEERDDVLFIGDDFFVVREQSDFEEDDDNDGGDDKVCGQEDSCRKLLGLEQDKTASQKEGRAEQSLRGKKTSGRKGTADCSVTLGLEESDGRVYMQVLPL